MKFPECDGEQSHDAIDGRRISREQVLCAFLVCRLQVPLLAKLRHHVLPNSNNPFRDLLDNRN